MGRGRVEGKGGKREGSLKNTFDYRGDLIKNVPPHKEPSGFDGH